MLYSIGSLMHQSNTIEGVINNDSNVFTYHNLSIFVVGAVVNLTLLKHAQAGVRK